MELMGVTRNTQILGINFHRTNVMTPIYTKLIWVQYARLGRHV